MVKQYADEPLEILICPRGCIAVSAPHAASDKCFRCKKKMLRQKAWGISET